MEKGRIRLSYKLHDQYFMDGKFHPIPRDENGIYTVEFLKEQGVEIIASEIIEETHFDSDGQPYKQRMRMDTFAPDAAQVPITFFYNWTRGKTGLFPIASK